MWLCVLCDITVDCNNVASKVVTIHAMRTLSFTTLRYNCRLSQHIF